MRRWRKTQERRHPREGAASATAAATARMTGHMRFVFNGIEDMRPLVRDMSDDELRKLLERIAEAHRRRRSGTRSCASPTTRATRSCCRCTSPSRSTTVQWLASKGHDWVPAGGFNANRQHAAHERRRLRASRSATSRSSSATGAAFHYETAATELIQDRKGRVIGVRALTPEGFATFNAKAVVLACGSFEANRGDARALSRAGLGHDPRARRAVQHRRRAAHGDGHRRDAARKLDHVPRFAAGHRDAAVHDSSVHVHRRALVHRYMYPYAIMVNMNGERFVDEGRRTLRGRTYAKHGPRDPRAAGRRRVPDPRREDRASSISIPPNYKQGDDGESAIRWRSSPRSSSINVADFVKTVREFNAAMQPGLTTPTATSSTASARRASRRRRATTRWRSTSRRSKRFPCAAE